jgi:hypothetical protein
LFRIQDGHSALIFCGLEDHAATAKLLIEAGGDMNLQNEVRRVLLCRAMR